MTANKAPLSPANFLAVAFTMGVGWFAFSVSTSSIVHAKTYSKEFCGTVKKMHADLIKEGTQADMARGAAWALANLSRQRKDRIKRFIQLEEIINFQCEKPRKPKEKPKSGKQAKGKPATGAKAKTTSKKKPTRASKAKPRKK